MLAGDVTELEPDLRTFTYLLLYTVCVRRRLAESSVGRLLENGYGMDPVERKYKSVARRGQLSSEDRRLIK